MTDPFTKYDVMNDDDTMSGNTGSETPPPPPASSSPIFNSPKLEVNFDTNPTQLYNYIQQRQWKQAVERIHSEREETWTWVYRLDNKTQKMRWRILPLHAALLFKSDSATIKALLEVYPMGVQMTDDQGMLPVRYLL